MNLLGYKFLEMHPSNVVMKVPYSKIVASLAGLIVPLLIGILIARWKPAWGAKARKVRTAFVTFAYVSCLDTSTVCHLCFGICDHFWHNFELSHVCSNHLAGCRFVSWMLFKQIWRFTFSGLLLPLLGFMCGCFSSILLRQAPEDVTAIAIETGVQNTGIAIMLLKVRRL